jgi:protein TonB
MTLPRANLNGKSHYSAQAESVRVAPWGSLVGDPLERVLELGRGRAMQAMVVALILAVSLHGMAAVRTAYIHAEMIAWTLRLAPVIDGHLVQTVDIETDKPAPAPPPPPPEEKKEEEPVVKHDVPKEAPAAAAQAGQVLAQNPDKEVLNFTDNVFTVGSSDRYAGGDTTSNGTNQNAVHARHVADTGTGSGQGQAMQQVAVDLSRTAQLAGSGEWRCPFPPEADADQVDEASAVIEVTVGADGKASRANVLSDPGHGFGREARACAIREAYVPALDREGRAVASTKRFRVKFER